VPFLSLGKHCPCRNIFVLLLLPCCVVRLPTLYLSERVLIYLQ
jgi:hypothetical protein